MIKRPCQWLFFLEGKLVDEVRGPWLRHLQRAIRQKEERPLIWDDGRFIGRNGEGGLKVPCHPDVERVHASELFFTGVYQQNTSERSRHSPQPETRPAACLCGAASAVWVFGLCAARGGQSSKLCLDRRPRGCGARSDGSEPRLSRPQPGVSG